MSLVEREQQTEIFLKELFRGIKEIDEKGRMMVVYAKDANVQTDEKGKKANHGFWAKPFKPGAYIDTNSNAYVCISSFLASKNQKTGESRYWRTEAGFHAGMALMVDDIGTGKGSKGEMGLDMFRHCPPTAIVETSPGNYQLWYFMKEPVTDKRQFKALLSSFVKYVLNKGGDHTIKDITRIARMPIGYNNKRDKEGNLKYADENGKPWQVRLFWADYRRRYTPEDLEKAFNFTIEYPQQRDFFADLDAELETDADRQLKLQERKINRIWLKKAIEVTDRLKLGEGSDGKVVMNMSGKYRIRCPWGDDHTNGDPYGAYFRGGIDGAEFEFVFGCGHDSCRQAGRTWSVFVDQVVMPTIDAEVMAADRWWHTVDFMPQQ